MFNLFAKNETRSSVSSTVSLSSVTSVEDLFNLPGTVTGESITEEKALGVTAIGQAVNVIAGTISTLPVHVYKNTPDGVVKDTSNPLYYIVHDRPNDFQTSASFLLWFATRLVLGNRATAYVVRNKTGKVKGIMPLDPSKLTIEQRLDGETVKRTYIYNYDGGTQRYDAANVIDVMRFPKADGLNCYNPIHVNRDVIALMLATQKYAGKLFASGGVPPLVLTGTAMSPQTAERASNNIAEAVRASENTKSNVLVVPTGHDLKPVGLDPSKSQLVELREFHNSEVSRIFNIAPAILHDLSKGTYSNVEQQNTSFVTQTLQPLIIAIEQEFNAKLFGNRNTTGFIKFNMDGLLRGDFATRMAGLQQAVNSAIMTPNEAREKENLPPKKGGDELFIQGATVPLAQQAKAPAPVAAPQPEPEPAVTDEGADDNTQEDSDQ